MIPFLRLSIAVVLICGCPALALTGAGPLSQSDPLVICRVLSINPFTVELVDDPSSRSGFVYAPRPIVRNIKHSAKETSHLRYGDIISARVYSHQFDAGGELGLGTGYRTILKLSENANLNYDKKGVLIFYARAKNSSSYLTIYRDGTVLCQDTPGNYIRNKRLPDAELRRLMREYSALAIYRLASETKLKEHDPALVVSFGKYQQLNIVSPPPRLNRFLERLDSFIEGYVQSATYRISYKRGFVIKDWPYEDIIPLDEIGDYYGTNYRYKHIERLSKIKPTPSFMKEAAERCEEGCALYRYKNKIYWFTFGICSNGTTGTLACFQAVELQFGKLEQPNQGYLDWPSDLGTGLKTVSKEGLDIPADEYMKHKQFYTSLLTGSSFMYKDGDYIYQGVSTTYH